MSRKNRMSFRAALRSRTLLADGGMGTELQARGLAPGTPADRWVLDHPEKVLTVHAGYVAAGSQIVLTNTLTANGAIYSAEVADLINHAAVGLARRSGARWVAGSMGPGADEAQARALAGVELFWLETQVSLAQALASVAACRRADPGLPIVVTFSFHLHTATTADGDTPSQIGRELERAGVDAVGVNCGKGFEQIEPVLDQFAQNSSLPLVLKPNAGIPSTVNEHRIYPFSPKEWARHMNRLLTPRIRVQGGCCGTTPAHIALLREV